MTGGIIGALIMLAAVPVAHATEPGPVQATHDDPYANCTAGSTPFSTSFNGSVVEPSVAVGPFDHRQVIGVFQQDRWSDGGAKGLVAAYSDDAGRRFAETPLPLSQCAPGGLPFDRASDPWISIGPDGTAYASGLLLSFSDTRNGVGVTVSHDGGREWSHTTATFVDDQLEFGNDKPSITADPVRIGTAYQVWDREDFGPNKNRSKFVGTEELVVTHDFGRTWSAARPIVTPGPNGLATGGIIVVDSRTGTVYCVYNLLIFTDPSLRTFVSSVENVIRSGDGGRTWSTPVTAMVDTSVPDVDPNTGMPLRTGFGFPSTAIDPRSGALYVADEGAAFTSGRYNQVQLVRSVDGGRTWSAAIRVNGDPNVEAFDPQVAVTETGTVAVSYYDLRDLPAGDTTTLPTSTWLATAAPGATRFSRQRRIAPDFDLFHAPTAVGGPFLGDYQGLAAAGRNVEAFFVASDTTTGTGTAAFSAMLPGSR